MALLGLGLLAGTGALFDYWPLGGAYPQPGPALTLPVSAEALPVGRAIALAARVRVPDLSTPRPVATSAPGPAVRDVAVVAPRATGVPRVDALAVTSRSDFSIGNPVELPQPTMRIAFAVSPAPRRDAADSFDFEPLPSPYQIGEPTSLPALATATASDDDSDGLITGVLKKTGSSIVTAGARTGASIFGAVRVLGGAVRRALPN